MVTAQKSPIKQRRKSSVGRINLGDNATGGIQSTRSPAELKKAEEENRRSLNEVSREGNDADVFLKLWLTIRILCYRHIWIVPLSICVMLNLTYLLSNNYTETNPLHRFLCLSYRVEESGLYEKGWKDFCFVGYMMIIFTFLREFMMQEILRPMALYYGLRSKSKISRYTEQMYACFYYGVTGPLGLYIMYHSPLWYFKTAEFWRDYPHLQLPYLFKFFYLFQAGFWAQQSVILMLQLEKPRKDFKELILHHIITMSLISLSLMFNFTQIGLCIYVTMDISDFFLGMSKSLNYIGSALEVPFFLTFIVIWFYMRHYMNLKILWSVATEYLTIGPSILDFSTQQYKCWISQPMVFVLIFALQLLNAYWFFLILRILFRIVFFNVVKDERSDSETEDDCIDESEL